MGSRGEEAMAVPEVVQPPPLTPSTPPHLFRLFLPLLLETSGYLLLTSCLAVVVALLCSMLPLSFCCCLRSCCGSDIVFLSCRWVLGYVSSRKSRIEKYWIQFGRNFQFELSPEQSTPHRPIFCQTNPIKTPTTASCSFRDTHLVHHPSEKRNKAIYPHRQDSETKLTFSFGIYLSISTM